MAKKNENQAVVREFRDGLLTLIFGNEKHKDLALSLYNAINESSYTNINDFRVIQVENALCMEMKGDNIFILADSLNIYDLNPTFSPRILPRMVVYSARYLQHYIRENNLEKQLYTNIPIKFPRCPKPVAFYIGELIRFDETSLRMSELYEGGPRGSIEINVRMINLDYGRNKEMMQNCKPLSDYSHFISALRNCMMMCCFPPKIAVDEALDELSDDSEVKRIIYENKAKVAKMFLYNENVESMEDVAMSLKQAGYSMGAISKITGTSIEVLKNLK